MSKGRISRGIDVSPNVVYWTVVLALLACSLFFVVDVQLRKKSWQSDKQLQVKSGEAVEILKVIDGDEVSVKHQHGTFVVRLLGVKSFNPSANEPGLSGLGAQTVQALERILDTKKPITVHFKEFKQDKAKRLLAYIHVGDVDVGERLVKGGFSVAYTRYPFSRENAYLAAELEAQREAKGLWANEKAVSRVHGWKGSWDAQRQDG